MVRFMNFRAFFFTATAAADGVLADGLWRWPSLASLSCCM